MTTENNEACRCGAPIRIIDIYGSSATVFCTKCGHYSLGVARNNVRRVIFLADFHVRRGEESGQRPFHDLEMATELAQGLADDVWPTSATVNDYGIESERHFGALQHAVRCGSSAFDLDRVMGDGRAITELVHCAPGQPYGPVEFRTPYDGLVAPISDET